MGAEMQRSGEISVSQRQTSLSCSRPPAAERRILYSRVTAPPTVNEELLVINFLSSLGGEMIVLCFNKNKAMADEYPDDFNVLMIVEEWFWKLP